MTDHTQTIEKAARDVYAALRGGYNERVYEEAMAVEFRRHGIPYEVSRTVEIFYDAQKVGEHELDFTCTAGEVVVELKALASISKATEAQLRAYLRTTGRTRGMLINFPPVDKPEPDIKHVHIEDT